MFLYARHWKIVVVFCLAITLLAGCTGEDKSELPPLPKDGSGTIRILFGNEEQFMSEYGNAFHVKYPEIEFEILPTRELFKSLGKDGDYYQNFIEFIKNKQLDVVMLAQSDYEHLASVGILYPIESLIKDEKYPIDDFHPGVIDLLREKGGNTLYGVAAQFQSSALFYNAELFKEYGVDPPRHKMSVQEMLELAEQFPSKSNSDKDRTYGFHSEYMSPSQMLLLLAEMSNLQIVDPTADKIVMDSEAWKSIFVSYAELVKEKKTNLIKSNDDMRPGQGFAQGNVAMTIGNSYMIAQIENAHRYSQDGEKKKGFEWGMVTVPVDPANPDESPMVQLGSIFAIPKDSLNKNAAWEFVKFSAGPEMARINGRASSKLTTRTKYQQEIAGKSPEAFTLLKPGSNARALYKTLSKNKVSDEFFSAFHNKLDESIMAVADGKKSPEQAYEQLLPELQKQLDIDKNKREDKKAEK
ncbi:extracellular solute-binding protein [Paenibacillus sp. SC116]|uniref:ABC transporter substrate-binding protein n=1 Tax=Paenibacillus sp. SC116 TaxID=2968986 RepID=UPI00215AFBE1|nr:extracellular solute-binding protein [Paenibacillus sp. SC116]MCR8846143.1 extracellular solute-binding protein [Paenibacillus sp. SC116]